MESIASITHRLLVKDPTLTIEEATTIAIKRQEIEAKEHVEHDWMHAQLMHRSVPMDARSSPFVERRNGIEYRISPPIYTQGGMKIEIPAIPSDPRQREAHIKWEAKNKLGVE